MLRTFHPVVTFMDFSKHSFFMDPSTLWTLQIFNVMDSSIPQHYGLINSSTLWTLQFFNVMDSSILQRYGLFNSTTLWTRQFIDVKKLVNSPTLCDCSPRSKFKNSSKMARLWTLHCHGLLTH